MSNNQSSSVHEVYAPPPSPISDIHAKEIRLTRVIMQRTRFDADAFICIPLSNEPWRLWLVSVDQIESCDWYQLQSAPEIYVAGKCDDGKFYEVAVDKSYILLLEFNGFDCKFDSDPTKLADTAARVHGKWVAKPRAEARFLRNAVKAIQSGRDRGLELCPSNNLAHTWRSQGRHAELSN
ncbi:hypothetical protein K469DRAFT_685380 [Zopfia rhizophila CBS 207.26]|uniref:Uncharacterized protein n=1 Tax=Zopfia rhizophila CBS 207.26 TaxID=1314779 RepID=A0A6A6EBX3_9PEZI|nr:hypothetical protein K469DRAFT_685380 [Zopfia rhizophila CBS 207.26]